MSTPAVLNQSSGPATKVAAITPSDVTDLTGLHLRALWVGGAGNVALIATGDTTNSGAGTAVTIFGIPAGTVLPISAKKVMATGTTATNIAGLI